MTLHEPPQIFDRSDFRVNGMIQQLRAKIGEAVTVLFLHVDLYFSMFYLSPGWRCEPGLGDLFRLVDDASVSGVHSHLRASQAYDAPNSSDCMQG